MIGHWAGQRARKRIPLRLPQRLAAAALMTALLGAILAAPPPARAAEGDVTGNTGVCHLNTLGDSPPYIVRPDHSTAAVRFVHDQSGSQKWIPCPAEYEGYHVSVTPNGTLQPTIKLLPPALNIVLSDNVVSNAGGEVAVLTFKFEHLVQFAQAEGDAVDASAIPAATAFDSYTLGDDGLQSSAIVRFDWARSSGELRDPPRESWVGQYNTWPEAGLSVNLPIPQGTRPGEYIISAQISYDEFTNDARLDGIKSIEAWATLTVSDSTQANLASAALSLANAAEDNPLTSADEERPGTASAAAAGGAIWLRLDALDALGNPSKSSGLTAATAFGLGANLAFHAANPAGGAGDPIGAAGLTSVSIAEAASPMYLMVSKADGQPAVVDVHVLVVGGTVVETEPITLTFTGPPAAVQLGDGASVGRPDAGAETQAEITLATTDAAGSAVPTPSSVTFSITDADGNAVSASTISAQADTVGSSTETTRDDGDGMVVLLTVSDAVTPGDYTVSAALVGVADSAATATLTVTGPPANIRLTTDQSDSASVGDVIIVSAEVTDADGNPVADGIDVTFIASGTSLVGVGVDANPDVAGRQSQTAGGAATARYAVIGAGSSVVSGVAAGQAAVILITSTAAASADDAPAGPQLSDLSNETGLVSYFGPDTTASVLLDLLGESADALWLSHFDGGWLLYATVNGALVPGARDFAVTRGDVLYISN